MNQADLFKSQELLKNEPQLHRDYRSENIFALEKRKFANSEEVNSFDSKNKISL